VTGGWKRWRRPVLDIGLIAALLAALNFLPSDNSLADRRKQGVLRYCVSESASALTEPRELQLAEGIARQLDLRLEVQTVANIGRSFNPRDWNLSRGQCDMIGGLANTETNRNFLTLLPNGSRIALVRAGPAEAPPRGAEMGVYLRAPGLDRVRLASYLRAQGWRAQPLRTPEALSGWLAGGGQAIVSTLTQLPPDTGTNPLPPEAGESTDLAFGLWRGDVTLTRAIRNALERELDHIPPE